MGVRWEAELSEAIKYSKNQFISYLKENTKKIYIKYELNVRVHHNETYPWSMVQIFYKT